MAASYDGPTILKPAAEMEASKFDKELLTEKVVFLLGAKFHSRTFGNVLANSTQSIFSVFLNSVNFYYPITGSILFILARVDSVLCIRTWINIPDQSLNLFKICIPEFKSK